MSDVTCGACWKPFPDTDAASLTDRNRHGWLLCPECVGQLWQRNRPVLTDPGPEPEATPDKATAYYYALPVLVGSMSILLESLKVAAEHTNVIPPWILKHMAEELDNARRVYMS